MFLFCRLTMNGFTVLGFVRLFHGFFVLSFGVPAEFPALFLIAFKLFSHGRLFLIRESCSTLINVRISLL